MKVDQRAKKSSEYAPSLVGAILGAGLGYILPKIGECVQQRLQAKGNARADLESGLEPQAEQLAAATLGQMPSESRDTFFTAQVELDEMSPAGDVGGLAPPLPPPRAHLSRT
ncbi:hypothetical protein CCUS01_02137 [Colletotrichum cuscutae]|uniref:Uncharacterized protein n=1 Tax=Colletotrichum cuscutae TaxID=1209917 RepID=A0AAI9U502_9PEZI|nr:hypothetical protein CCUS01_02137 [Colletotrichum cuscutae]